MDGGQSKARSASVIPLTERLVKTNPDDLSAATDDELMLLARGGLRRAFDALMARYQPALRRFANRQLGNDEAARDVIQNTFLDLYRQLSSYQARGHLRALLFSIVLNQCRMVRRGLRRSVRASERLRGQPIEPVELPSNLLLKRERLRELDRALEKLRRKQREVVQLRFSAGLSLGEIASVLGISVGTVKSRLFNGLERLHGELEEGARS